MVRRIIDYIHDMILLRKNPQKFAKKLGVNLKGRLFVYGGNRGMFGSEPFMIQLGDNVHITGECQFLTHDGSTLIFRQYEPTLEITKPIVIGDNVFIGFRTIIMPGVTIGNNCVIGAGSVVTKDIPDNSLAVGNPCRVIKTSDELFEKLKENSLGLGHLKGDDKAKEVKKIYNIK